LCQSPQMLEYYEAVRCVFSEIYRLT
jgi:hypothetical protein